jgi:hypothetical protein
LFCLCLTVAAYAPDRSSASAAIRTYIDLFAYNPVFKDRPGSFLPEGRRLVAGLLSLVNPFFGGGRPTLSGTASSTAQRRPDGSSVPAGSRKSNTAFAVVNLNVRPGFRLSIVRSSRAATPFGALAPRAETSRRDSLATSFVRRFQRNPAWFAVRERGIYSDPLLCQLFFAPPPRLFRTSIYMPPTNVAQRLPKH